MKLSWMQLGEYLSYELPGKAKPGFRVFHVRAYHTVNGCCMMFSPTPEIIRANKQVGSWGLILRPGSSKVELYHSYIPHHPYCDVVMRLVQRHLDCKASEAHRIAYLRKSLGRDYDRYERPDAAEKPRRRRIRDGH